MVSNYNSVYPTATASNVDIGLRNYFLGIYKLMTTALATTGIIAWLVSESIGHVTGPLWWVFSLLPLAFVFILSAGINRLSESVAYVLFYAFAASMGLSLSALFSVFTGASIAKALFISAGTFAAFSLYGYTTGKDLSRLGGFLFMGLIGIIIAGLVNLFFASTLVSFVISCITVLVFVGFTAYDTQQLKQEYLSNGNVYGFSSQTRSSIYGALQLYLDFINIFVSLLEITGIKRD